MWDARYNTKRAPEAERMLGAGVSGASHMDKMEAGADDNAASLHLDVNEGASEGRGKG
jgi:hypothetical protein